MAEELYGGKPTKKKTTKKSSGKAKGRKPANKKSAADKKPKTIKDRIKNGAKVHVSDRGGVYIVYDGKKHPVC